MAVTPARADVYADRLDFALPDFTRLTWVSDEARAAWEPRIGRIAAAWAELEWLAVAAGVRACALKRLPPEAFVREAGRWADRGLLALPLGLEGAPTGAYASTAQPAVPGQPGVLCVAVGRHLEDVRAFRRAWDGGDHDTMGRLLGFPACCRRFFEDVWVRQQCVDTTWAMAASGRDVGAARTVEIEGPPGANILWRWMAVRPVPHLPCRADCAETAGFAAALRRVGEAAGYAEELAWAYEILDWPVEWSGLHGIAEVKTPVLKVSARTDATAGRYVVRRRGTGYPPEGARGLDFPFQVPARPIATGSAGYQRGLANLIQLETPPPPWHHTDNGFASRHQMDRQHEPLVAFARGQLEGVAGNVLDLGCGNGALLAKICRGRPDLTPFGIDRAPRVVEHARELHPRHPDGFHAGDMFDPATWQHLPRSALVLLMAGRLLEVAPERAAGLRGWLAANAGRLVVYVYPGWSAQSFEEVVRAADLVLEEAGGDWFGVASVPDGPPPP